MIFTRLEVSFVYDQGQNWDVIRNDSRLPQGNGSHDEAVVLHSFAWNPPPTSTKYIKEASSCSATSMPLDASYLLVSIAISLRFTKQHLQLLPLLHTQCFDPLLSDIRRLSIAGRCGRRNISNRLHVTSHHRRLTKPPALRSKPRKKKIRARSTIALEESWRKS
jgi:hypothetical protein